MFVKLWFTFQLFYSINCRHFTFFTIQALKLCKYVLAETQNSCIWNYNTITEQSLFFYNHCFFHKRLKFMSKYASTVLWRHQIVYVLMHWLKRIPRKLKWLDFHARIVMISSCFIPCSKEWQAPYGRRNTSLCHEYLTKAPILQMQAEILQLYSGESLHVLPYPKTLHVDPDSRSKRETCGVIIQDGVFSLPLKYFLLHFCILTWYPFMQMGSFFHRIV